MVWKFCFDALTGDWKEARITTEVDTSLEEELEIVALSFPLTGSTLTDLDCGDDEEERRKSFNRLRVLGSRVDSL